MKLGCQSAPTNDTHLKYLARYGVRNICGYPAIADGRIEASFRVNPQHLSDALAAWFTQRGKGNGQPVKVEIRKSE